MLAEEERREGEVGAWVIIIILAHSVALPSMVQLGRSPKEGGLDRRGK